MTTISLKRDTLYDVNSTLKQLSVKIRQQFPTIDRIYFGEIAITGYHDCTFFFYDFDSINIQMQINDNCNEEDVKKFIYFVNLHLLDIAKGLVKFMPPFKSTYKIDFHQKMGIGFTQ